MAHEPQNLKTPCMQVFNVLQQNCQAMQERHPSSAARIEAVQCGACTRSLGQHAAGARGLDGWGYNQASTAGSSTGTGTTCCVSLVPCCAGIVADPAEQQAPFTYFPRSKPGAQGSHALLACPLMPPPGLWQTLLRRNQTPTCPYAGARRYPP